MPIQGPPDHAAKHFTTDLTPVPTNKIGSQPDGPLDWVAGSRKLAL